MVALFKLASPIQFSLLSSIFKFTHSRPTETFTTLYRLLWPTLTSIPVIIIILFTATRLYHRSLNSFGWSFPARLRLSIDRRKLSPLAVSALAGLILAGMATLFPVYILPERQTILHQNVESSAAFALGFSLASILAAPFVEETIFRGILYPALLKRTGDDTRGHLFAVAGTAALFLAVHIDVYRDQAGVPRPGHLAAIAAASVGFTIMRAYSRRLLPCYVMHTIFNLCASVKLLLLHLGITGAASIGN